MAQKSSVEAVEQGEEYTHVRFRDPDDFETIRTPDWAARAAGSVVEGAEVRTGRDDESDDWTVQSVLLPGEVEADEAREKATQIVEKIES